MSDSIIVSISKNMSATDDLHFVGQTLVDKLIEEGYSLNVIQSPKSIKLPTEGVEKGQFSKSRSYLLIGMDAHNISQLFHIIDIETNRPKNQKQGRIIVVDLPGMNIVDDLNNFLVDYMDRGLIKPEVFEILYGAWNFKDTLDLLTLFKQK